MEQRRRCASGDRLVSQVTRRVDAEDFIGHVTIAPPPDLVNRSGVENPGQLDRFRDGSEFHRQVSGKREIAIAMRREPFGMVRPDDHHHALPRANAFHLRQSSVATMRWLRGEHGARNDEFSRSTGHRKRIEEPADEAHLCRLMTARRAISDVTLQFYGEDFAQWGSWLNSGQLIAAADELKGQAPATGADLDDTVHAIREPSDDGGMQALGRNKAVVELGFKSIEELPGETRVALGIGRAVDQQMTTVVCRDGRQVLPRISLEQRARADSINCPHCTRPNFSPFRTPGRCGGNPLADSVATDARTQPRDFRRSESGRAARGYRYSSCDGQPAQ